jgi:preprotein translocase subunit SecG
MMWIIGILTVFLILDCLFLMLLVLVQLPKKEAGMGQAFGGAATDALFGAGSGNALTKMTKYATVIFFVLTLGLSLLNAAQARGKKNTLERTLQSVKEAPAALPPGPIKPTDSSVVPTNMPGNAPAPTNVPSTNPPVLSPAPTPAPATSK